jgi:hypothetical protein
MAKVVQRRPLLFLLVAVVLSSSVIYATVLVFHSAFPFHRINYLLNSHHFLPDPRVNDGPFVFLRALGQYDAQWYLKIGATGYPAHPTVTTLDDKSIMDGLTYAFFPLYPLLIATATVVIGNVELAAFVVSNLLMVLDALSLYFVIGRLYNPAVAVKTTLLLFLFPFSIFFRSYFAEGLQLFLLIWFAYSLMQKKFLPGSICLGLLNIAKGSGMLLNVLFVFLLAQYVFSHKLTLTRGLLCLVLLATPLSLWVIYNYLQTGNPLYFYAIQKSWDSTPVYLHLVENLWSIIHLFELSPHSFHSSFINASLAIYVFLLLILSRKHLPPILWWISFLLWFTPFISIDLMSFSRYQSVSFPLFLFASLLTRNNKIYTLVAIIFFGLLLITSLYFVNWYWVG